MKYRIRNRYIVDIDAQIEANDMQDAIDQARDATVADLVTPRDGVTVADGMLFAINIPLRVATDPEQT